MMKLYRESLVSPDNPLLARLQSRYAATPSSSQYVTHQILNFL